MRDGLAPVGAMLLVAALAGAMAVAFFPLPADDAYIVARYANNIAAGRGMVYNEGEAVNALTSPFHLGVLVLLQPLASDFVTVYRALCAFAVAAVLAGCAWRAWGRSMTSAHFLALTLACPFLVFWTVGGLETPILLAVCTAIAFLCRADDRRSAAAIVALAGLAVLIRYDAVLFVAPVGGYALWRYRTERAVWLALAAGAVAIGAWMAFTLARFGDVLPTSFYVKAGRAPAQDELVRGALYVASFLCLTWAWTAPVIGRRATPANGALRMLWLGLALTFAYALFASTRHMMYGYRLLVPFLPALVVALLGSRIARGARAGLAFVALAGWQAALAAFMYFHSQNPSLALIAEGRSEASERFEFSHLGARHTAGFLATAEGQAEAIRKHWASTGATGAPRVVVSTGGALPYHLPEAYVLEQLVSFRHDCKPFLEPLADYAQVIYDTGTAEDVARERARQQREVVARFTLVADGLREKPLPLAIEIWYRRAEIPNPLPRRIGDPCL
jgi:hypothetical protein